MAKWVMGNNHKMRIFKSLALIALTTLASLNFNSVKPVQAKVQTEHKNACILNNGKTIIAGPGPTEQLEGLFDAGDSIAYTLTAPDTAPKRKSYFKLKVHDNVSGKFVFFPKIDITESGTYGPFLVPEDFVSSIVDFQVASYSPADKWTVVFNCVPATPPLPDVDLDAQTSAIAPLIINSQTSNMSKAVSQNVTDRLNGAAPTQQVTENGFLLQYGNGGAENNASAEAVNNLADADTSQTIGSVNYWIKGTGAWFGADNSSFSGRTVDLLVGADKLISPNTIFGVLAGYGKANFSTVVNSNAGSFDAVGYHVGIYGGKKLSDTLMLDGMIAYTRSDYDNKSGAVSGSFDASRITAAANLVGSIKQANYTFMPTISFLYGSENQDAYTDSASVVHASRNIRTGRLSVGPKILFDAMPHNNGTVQPWVAAKWEYDFSNQSVAASTSLPDLSDQSSARVSGGIDFKLQSNAKLSISGDAGGLGSNEYRSYSGSVSLNVPF